MAAAAADEEYSVDVDPVRPAAEDRVDPPRLSASAKFAELFALFDHDKDGFLKGDELRHFAVALPGALPNVHEIEKVPHGLLSQLANKLSTRESFQQVLLADQIDDEMIESMENYAMALYGGTLSAARLADKHRAIKERADKARKVVQEAIEKLQSGATSIVLNGENIGDAGVALLATALPQSKLEWLQLNSNGIGDAGVEALAEVLPQCRAIQSVSLQSNEIGDAGAAALAQAIPECKKLKWLILTSNQIGDAGAVALADARCGSVQELFLSSNQIGDVGALALLNALNESALVTLNVPSNRIGESVKSEMAEISDDEGLFFQGDKSPQKPFLNRNGKTINIFT